MSARFADLEAALKAQVATESAFGSVISVAEEGLAKLTTPPAFVLCIGTKDIPTVADRVVAGTVYVTKRVSFSGLIATRLSGDDGSSRTVTNGAWDLYDKVEAKLLGFVPNIALGQLRTEPCIIRNAYFDRIDSGAVDLMTEWSIDLEFQVGIH